MHPLPLTGLYASNPLGAMAAFGLLRVLNEMDDFMGAGLAWRETDDWQAIVFTPQIVSQDMLVNGLARRQQKLDMSPFNWSEDIRVQSTEFRKLLCQCIELATAESRHMADRFAAYGSELVTDGAKGLVKPTSFHMTSGQQQFLKSLAELGNGLRQGSEASFHEALFGPWRYEDQQHSMGWDPTSERMAALRHVAPTKEKAKSVRAAVWLATEALPLFPTAAIDSSRGVRLETTAFSRRNREWLFRWPVWQTPIALPTLRSLLAAPWLHSKHLDGDSLSRRGVVAVFQSVQYRFGQGYGIFRPASPLTGSQTAKTKLSPLLARVETGDEVIITRAGHPIARISGIKKPGGGRVLGRDAGLVEVPDDFNASLPEDVLNEFEG